MKNKLAQQQKRSLNKGNTVSIIFSGDFHANATRELESITKNPLLKKYRQEKYNAIRYHIILGDAKLIYTTSKSWLTGLSPSSGVMGNHDPVPGRHEREPEVDIGIGQTVYQIQAEPFVAYLKRGKAYTEGVL